jgi:hypothetical protein
VRSETGIGASGLFFSLIGLDMEEARRAQLGQMLTQHKALRAAMALMLLVGQGLGLKALFNAYPTGNERRRAGSVNRHHQRRIAAADAPYRPRGATTRR